MVSTSTFLVSQPIQSGMRKCSHYYHNTIITVSQVSHYWHHFSHDFTWKYREIDQFHICESFTSISDGFTLLSPCFTWNRVKSGWNFISLQRALIWSLSALCPSLRIHICKTSGLLVRSVFKIARSMQFFSCLGAPLLILYALHSAICRIIRSIRAILSRHSRHLVAPFAVFAPSGRSSRSIAAILARQSQHSRSGAVPTKKLRIPVIDW